jgi:hypothetical protein
MKRPNHRLLVFLVFFALCVWLDRVFAPPSTAAVRSSALVAAHGGE